MSGRSLAIAIVCGPAPAMLKLMMSDPGRVLAVSIAARSVQSPVVVAQMSSVVSASPVSATESTTIVADAASAVAVVTKRASTEAKTAPSAAISPFMITSVLCLIVSATLGYALTSQSTTRTSEVGRAKGPEKNDPKTPEKALCDWAITPNCVGVTRTAADGLAVNGIDQLRPQHTVT